MPSCPSHIHTRKVGRRPFSFSPSQEQQARELHRQLVASTSGKFPEMLQNQHAKLVGPEALKPRPRHRAGEEMWLPPERV